MFSPYYAMNRLTRCVTNGTAWKGLLRSFRCALITLTQAFFNKFNLTLVASSARFN